MIHWGIIGCGNVTEIKSGPALQLAADSKLHTVMRRNASKAQDYARRHHVDVWYDDATKLISDPAVDIVYIATPVGSHAELATLAAKYRKPTYVEKPMARNATEARKMIAAFEQAGVPLFVAYYRRALPRFLEAKRLIDDGALGTISSVQLRYTSAAHRKYSGAELPWRLQPRLSGGGLILDLGCHALDIVDFLLGPLQDVHGQAHNRTGLYPPEEQVVMSFRTTTGVLGSACWDFASDQHEDEMVIAGTDGCLEMSIFGSSPLVLTQGSSRTTFPIENPRHIQLPLIQTIVDELLGRGTCPSTGHTALRTTEVLDSTLQEYYGGRNDEFWERPETWPGRVDETKSSGR